ncbi:hypothetical protein VNO77_07296 [Canavalia gladiata]|uniref:Uncharacterized protein n=1 Tax=Canavalia gladiata TaxID=3824 RepID=A0AAN9M916_CANGL
MLSPPPHLVSCRTLLDMTNYNTLFCYLFHQEFLHSVSMDTNSIDFDLQIQTIGAKALFSGTHYLVDIRLQSSEFQSHTQIFLSYLSFGGEPLDPDSSVKSTERLDCLFANLIVIPDLHSCFHNYLIQFMQINLKRSRTKIDVHKEVAKIVEVEEILAEDEDFDVGEVP